MKRRDFVKLSSLGTTAIILDGCKTKDSSEKKQIVYPVAGKYKSHFNMELWYRSK